jgi:hypothetical protein
MNMRVLLLAACAAFASTFVISTAGDALAQACPPGGRCGANARSGINAVGGPAGTNLGPNGQVAPNATQNAAQKPMAQPAQQMQPVKRCPRPDRPC